MLLKSQEILVVEDDRTIRRLIRMVLEREGYQVHEAADGLEAVVKLGVAQYDVIVLDLMLPNLDGFAFMTQNESHLKRIIVTSAASPSLIRERLRGTPFDMLPKPFDITDLVGRVRACIVSQGPSS